MISTHIRPKILGVVGFLLLFAVTTVAEAGPTTYEWTGGGDGTTWEDTGNWSSGIVPGSSQTAKLLFVTGKSTITTAGATTVQSLEIDDGVTLTVSGSFNCERDLVVKDTGGNQAATINGTGAIVMQSKTGGTVIDVEGAGDTLSIANLTLDNGTASNGVAFGRTNMTVEVTNTLTWTDIDTGFTLTDGSIFSVPTLTIPTGQVLDCAGGTVRITGASGQFVNNGTFTVGTGTLEFTGSTPSIAAGANPTVLNNLTITGGTLTPSVALQIGNDLTVTGTLSGGSQTVTFATGADGVHAVSGGGSINFNNLTINDANTLNLSSAISVSGTLLISATTAVLSPGSQTVTISGGTWDNNAGANGFAEGTSTVKFAGAAPTLPDNAETFYNLEIAATTSAVANQDYTVTNEWISTTNKFSGSTYTVNFDGTAVGYSGAATTPFNDVVIIGADTNEVFTLNSGDAMQVDTLTVNANGTFTMSGNATLYIATSATINGTFNASGSTPMITDTGSKYSFTVNSGSTVNVTALNFEDVNDTGMLIAAAPTALTLDNVNFSRNATQTTGVYLNFDYAVGASAHTLTGCVFDGDTKFNVRTLTGSGDAAVTMSAAGDKGTESFENDNDSDANINTGSPVTGPGVGSSIDWPAVEWNNADGGDSNWSTGGNWVGGTAPGSADKVLIPDVSGTGANPVLDTTTTIGSLLIESGGGLTSDNVGQTLTINNSLTLESNTTMTISGSDAVDVGSDLTTDGDITINSTGGTTTVGGSLIVQANGSLTLPTGGANFTVTGNVTNQGSMVLTGYSGTVDVGGNYTESGAGTLTAGSSTFSFTGTTASITAGGSSFDGLTVSGSTTVTVSDALTVNGQLDVNGTLKLQSSLTYGGSASLEATAGTIEFTGAGTQTLPAAPGSTAYNNITISNTEGSTGVTLGGNIEIRSGATLNIASGSILSGSNKTITLEGTWDNDGTFIDGTSTLVSKGGTASIDGDAVTEFYNVTVTDTTTLSVGTIGSFKVAGTFTNNTSTSGSFSEGSSTVEFTGSPSVLTGSTKTRFNNITITGTLNVSTVTEIEVRNQWSNSGTYNGAGITVYFVDEGSDAGTIAGSSVTTFDTLKLENSGGTEDSSLTLDGTDDIIVESAFNILAGQTVTMNGTSTLELGTGIDVNGAGASLTVAGSPEATIEPQLSSAYYFHVQSSGVVNLDNVHVDGTDADGIHLHSNASTSCDLDSVRFTDSDGEIGTFLTIDITSATSFDFSGCSFGFNCEYNVETAVGSVTVTMTGYTGVKSGATYENEGAGSAIDWPAKTWNGSIDNQWSGPSTGPNSGLNWTTNNAPGGTDAVVIPDVTTDPEIDIDATIASLTIEDGAIVTSASGGYTFVVNGACTIDPDTGAGSAGRFDWDETFNAGSGDLQIGGLVQNDGTLNLWGTATTVVGKAIFGSLTNSGTLTNSNTNGSTIFQINGDVSNSGTMTLGTASIAGDFDNSGGTYTAGTSTITLSATSGSVTTNTTSGKFYGLTIPSGSTYTVVDDLYILTGGTLTVNGTLILQGDLTFEGTAALAGTGTIRFAGSIAQSIAAPSSGSYSTLEISNTHASGASLAASVTATDVTVLSGGKFVLGSNTLTVTGDFENNATVTSTGSTVDFRGNPSTIRGSSITTFNHIAIDLTNAVTASLAVATTTSPDDAFTVTGTFTNNEASGFTAGGSTVQFSGASGTIAGSQIITFNNLTILSGATLSIATGTTPDDTINVNGTWTNNGSFSSGTSIVRFPNPGGAIAGSSATSFNVVQVESGGTLTLNGSDDITVSGSTLPASPDDVGLLVRNGGTLTLTGSPTLRLANGISIGTSSVSGGTLNCSGTTPTIIKSGSAFSFDVYGGNVTISSLNLDGVNGSGLVIHDSTNKSVDIDGVNFTNGGSPLTGVCIDLQYTGGNALTAGDFNFSGCSFDTNCLYNVQTASDAADDSVSMTAFGGDKGDAAFENDKGLDEEPNGDGASGGSITWSVFTWNGATSTSWSTGSNWTPASPAGGPPAQSRVIITDQTNDPILDVTTSIGALKIANGASLNDASGGRSLTVTGNVTIENLGTAGTLTFDDTGNLVINGTIDNDGTITVGSSGTHTLGGTIDNSGTITIQSTSGNITISGNLNNTGSATFDLNNGGGADFAGSITLGGSFTNAGTATFDSGSSSTLIFDGTSGNITQAGDGLANVTVSTGSTYTADDAFTLSGTLDVNGTFELANSITYGSDFEDTAGTVSFVGTSNQTIPAPPNSKDYYGLTVGNSGGAVATIGGSLTVDNLLTVESGAEINGGASTTVTVNGNLTNDGTFTAGTSTVVFNGSPSTVGGSSTTRFNNITIAASAGLQLSGSNAVEVHDTWTNNQASGFTPGTSTVTFTGTSSTIAGTQITDFANLTIGSGVTLTVGGSNSEVHVSATLTNNGSGFASGTYTVQFNGSNAGIEGNALTINTVTFGSGATLDLEGTDDLTVQQTITVGSGHTLKLENTSTLRLGTGVTVNSGGQVQALAGSIQTITDTGSRFSFTVNGGNVDLDGVTFDGVNSAGLVVKDSANKAFDVDGVSFTNGDGTGPYLDLQYTGGNALATDDFAFSGCAFDANCLYNVQTPSGAAAKSVLLTGFSGAKGDAAYENDEGGGSDGAATGSIQWQVVTWDGGAGGGDYNWNTAANWDTDAVPPAGSTIIIPDLSLLANTGTPVLNVSTSIGSLTIQDGGALTSDNSTRTLTVTGGVTLESTGGTAADLNFLANDKLVVGGTLDNDGTFLHQGNGLDISGNLDNSGTFENRGTGAVVGGTLSNTGSGTIDLDTGAIRVEGSFTNSVASSMAPAGGTITLGAASGSGTGTITLGSGNNFYNLTIAANFTYTATDGLTIGEGTATATLDVNGTLKLQSSLTFAANTDFDDTAGTVIYAAANAAQTVTVPPNSKDYFDLSVENTGTAVATLGGSVGARNLTIASDGELGGSSATLTLSGNMTNDGTYTKGTSTVDFTGTAAVLSGSSTTDFNNVAIDLGNATTAQLTASASFKFSGAFTNNDTFVPSTYTVTASGASSTMAGSSTTEFNSLTIASGATLTLATSSTTKIKGTLTNSSSGVGVTGTAPYIVEFTGTNGQISGSAIEFDELLISGKLTLNGSDDIKVKDATTGFTVSTTGEFVMNGAVFLRLGGSGTKGRADIQGKFTALGSTPTVTDTGTRYSFTGSGASLNIDIDALNFVNPDANGLTVNDNSALTVDLDGIAFSGGPGTNPSYYINLLYGPTTALPGGTFTFSGCSFDANTQYNVRTVNDAQVAEQAINMTGFGGANGDASFERDKDGANTPDAAAGSIRWNVFTWDGSVSSDWSDKDNWTPALTSDGAMPADASVIIPDTSAINDPVLNITATVGSLKIQASGSFSNGANNTSLTVSGGLTIESSGSMTMANTGNLTVNGTIDNDGSLTYSGTGTFSVGTDVDNDGTFDQSAGSLSVSGNVDNALTLKINTATFSGSFTNTGTFDSRTGTLTLNGTGGTETVSGVNGTNDAYNLTIGAPSTYTATNNLVVAAALDINGTLKVNGSISFVTFDSTAGALEFSGTAAQSIPVPSSPSATVYNDIIISNSSAAITVADDITVGDLNIGAGATLTPTNGNAVVITIKDDFDDDGTFTTNDSSVIFSANASVIQSSSTTTFNDFTLSGGTISFSGTQTIKVQGDFTNNVSTAAFVSGNSTVEFNVAGTSNVAGSAATQFNNLTIATGTTLDVTNTPDELRLKGTFSNSGTYTTGSTHVYFEGTSGAIAGTTNSTFKFLTASGTLTLDGSDSLTVTGNGTSTVVISSAGKLDLKGTSTLTVGSAGTKGVVDVQGEFAASGAGPTLTHVDTYFSFDVTTATGKVTIAKLTFNGPDSDGLKVDDGASTTLQVNGVAFQNGQNAAGSYLQILHVGAGEMEAGTYTFTGCTFDAPGSLNNVKVANNANVKDNCISMAGSGGDGSGDANDDDPNDGDGSDTSQGAIRWPVTNWTGNSDSSWTNTANWDTGVVPTSTTRVVIDIANYTGAAADPVISSASVTVASLQLTAGTGGSQAVSLSFNSGSHAFTVTGSTTLASGGDAATLDFTSDGTLMFSGSVINGSNCVIDCSVAGDTPTLVFGAGVTNSGTIDLTDFDGAAFVRFKQGLVNSGTVTVGSNDIKLGDTSGSGSFTLTSGGTTWVDVTIETDFTYTASDAFALSGALDVNGTLKLANSVTYGTSFEDTAGTIEFVGTGAQSVPALPGAASYYNLIITNTGATATLGGAETVSNAFTISSNATFSGGSAVLTLAGSFTLNGTFTASTGTVTLTSASPTIPAASYYNLTLNGSGTATLGGTTTVSNTLSVSAGTLDIVANTLNLTGATAHTVSSGAAFHVTGAGTLAIEPTGSFTVNAGGTFKASSTSATVTRVGGSGSIDFAILGTCDITGLIFEYPNTDGLQIGDASNNPTVTNLDYITFQNHPGTSGTAFLTIWKDAPWSHEAGNITFGALTTDGTNVALYDRDQTVGGANAVHLLLQDRERGAGAGEDADSSVGDVDGDHDDDGVATTDSNPNGTGRGDSVVSWETTVASDVTGTVIGFPVAAFDLNDFSFYSTYVVTVDASGTDDRLWVRELDGDPSYSFDFDESTYGNIVTNPLFDTEGSGMSTVYVVYVGTDTGKIVKLVDDPTGMTLQAPAGDWSTPFSNGGVTNITTDLVLDGTNIYFGGQDGGGNNYVFGVDLADKGLDVSQATTNNVAVQGDPVWDDESSATKVYLGSNVDGATAYIFKLNVGGTLDANLETGNAASITAAPVYFNKKMHVGDSAGNMYGVQMNTNPMDPMSGWRTTNGSPPPTYLADPYSTSTTGGGGSIDHTPWKAFATGRVYFGDSAGYFYVVTEAKADLANFPTAIANGGFVGAPDFYQGKIAAGTNDGEFIIIDESTGTSLATYNFGSGLTVSDTGVSSDGNSYMVYTSDGILHFIPVP